MLFYMAVELGQKLGVIGYGVAEVPADYHCMAKSGSLLKATTGKDLNFRPIRVPIMHQVFDF